MIGEQLSDIWWCGRQWAVTEYGIEALDGTYHIEADRLAERSNAGKSNRLPDWPLHVCAKSWVDAEDFCSVFLIALVLHGHGAAFDPMALIRACRASVRLGQEGKAA